MTQISNEEVQSREAKWECKEQYCVEVPNRFGALEDLDLEVEFNSAWKTIRENINISAEESPDNFELNKHKKTWFYNRTFPD
jgi:hypothetical protein